MSERQHLVFISHASEDKAVADEVCAALEKVGVRCWIAPRDIKGGTNWAKSILDAIVVTRVMVLVFSKVTGKSPHVRREIERAVHRDIPIVPLRVEDVMPEGDLEYFLSSNHWIDLFPGPTANHLPRIQSTVRSLVGIKSEPTARSTKPASSAIAPPKASSRPPVEKPSLPPPPAPAKPAASRKWMIPTAIGVALLIVALAGAFAYLHSPSKGPEHGTSSISLDAAKSADTIDKARAALPALDEALKADPSNSELQSLSAKLHSLSDPPSVQKALNIKLVKIEPTEFTMGSPLNEQNRKTDEVQHRVAITEAYFIATTDVTQRQWRLVMNETFQEHVPRGADVHLVGQGDDYPVYYVSWDQANEFCRRLSGLTRQHFRLPTEIEWEFACRAGTTTTYFFGNKVDALADYAWFGNNSGNATHPVATKKPNPCGLYDMYGNVWEWCSDLYKPYPGGPVAPDKYADYHVVRGGAWASDESFCRSAKRYAFDPTKPGNEIGFRLAADAP
jgi:formylglycine-generating enzyme required for sulfatase activity